MTSYMTSSIRNDLKVDCIMSFIYRDLSVEIQTHKRTNRTLISYIKKLKMRIFGVSPLFKLKGN